MKDIVGGVDFLVILLILKMKFTILYGLSLIFSYYEEHGIELKNRYLKALSLK
jgi:hypothetical protein